jgi:hypothetical protein
MQTAKFVKAHFFIIASTYSNDMQAQQDETSHTWSILHSDEYQ